MTTKQKFYAAVSAAAIAAVAYLYIKSPTGYKGFYDNNTGSYLGSASAEDAQLNWHVRNGDNAIFAYSFDSKISSTANWPKVSNYIRKARRKGIKTFGIPYSSYNTMQYVENYNKAQADDSSRINAVISEIEPYNSTNKDSAYKAFFTTIRNVSNWAKRVGKMERICYMGWPTAACFDSIIVNTDRLFLHCYVQPSTMTGAGIRGYTKTRTTTVANLVNTRYASTPTFKYNLVIIFSCEPSFAYSYFQGNTFDKPFTDYQSYFNSYATTTEKNRLQLAGRQIFVSSYGKQCRP